MTTYVQFDRNNPKECDKAYDRAQLADSRSYYRQKLINHNISFKYVFLKSDKKINQIVLKDMVKIISDRLFLPLTVEKNPFANSDSFLYIFPIFRGFDFFSNLYSLFILSSSEGDLEKIALQLNNPYSIYNFISSESPYSTLPALVVDDQMRQISAPYSFFDPRDLERESKFHPLFQRYLSTLYVPNLDSWTNYLVDELRGFCNRFLIPDDDWMDSNYEGSEELWDDLKNRLKKI
jgi:hypothetical protein